MLRPDVTAADEDPCRSNAIIIAAPADDGGVAVGGQRDGRALSGGSNKVISDQLWSMLRPHLAGATTGEDPCRSNAIIIAAPADDGGVAGGGQRNGRALKGFANDPGSGQLWCQFRPPGATVAEEDPYRPRVPVLTRTADDGGVAVA